MLRSSFTELPDALFIGRWSNKTSHEQHTLCILLIDEEQERSIDNEPNGIKWGRGWCNYDSGCSSCFGATFTHVYECLVDRISDHQTTRTNARQIHELYVKQIFHAHHLQKLLQ